MMACFNTIDYDNERLFSSLIISILLFFYFPARGKVKENNIILFYLQMFD